MSPPAVLDVTNWLYAKNRTSSQNAAPSPSLTLHEKRALGALEPPSRCSSEGEYARLHEATFVHYPCRHDAFIASLQGACNTRAPSVEWVYCNLQPTESSRRDSRTASYKIGASAKVNRRRTMRRETIGTGAIRLITTSLSSSCRHMGASTKTGSTGPRAAKRSTIRDQCRCSPEECSSSPARELLDLRRLCRATLGADPPPTVALRRHEGSSRS